MKFTFNNFTYEVPEGAGISIEVVVDAEHADFNFVKDGDHVPMLGGVDEEGRPVQSWADLGITRVRDRYCARCDSMIGTGHDMTGSGLAEDFCFVCWKPRKQLPLRVRKLLELLKGEQR